MFRQARVLATLLPLTFAVQAAHADDDTAAATESTRPSAGGKVDTVVISTNKQTAVPPNTPSPTFGISATELESLNVVNTEDALKYAPNLHVRKRFIGDNNGVVSVRSTSTRQSARTLVYADGLLLSNLLGSDFSFPPRWSMVSPDEIRRVDVLYGPYSAQFPGNSLGTTVLISTAMPERFTMSGGVQYFDQSFSLFGVDRSFEGHRISGSIGNRSGDWAYVLSAERLDSKSQPLSFLTATRSTAASTAADVPVVGAIPYTDQTGKPGYVLGVNSEGITDTVNDQVKLKVTYDITSTLQLGLTAVDWRQKTDNGTGTFLTAADGSAINAGTVAIDGNRYTLAGNSFAPANGESRRRLYGVSLRSSNDGGWNYSVVASRFETPRDIARVANGPTSGVVNGPAIGTSSSVPGNGPGALTFADGSGWTVIDAQADYREDARDGGHWLALGVHSDRYDLDNATWTTMDWRSDNVGAFANAFGGRTETRAAYVQDTWSFAPDWKLIPGVRYERWNASDGARSLGATTLAYAKRSNDYWSPKLALQRDFGSGWLARLSVARAYRMPTVSELFQGRITGTALVNNDPNLQPERALSKDFTVERGRDRASLRVSLYEDDVRDALFSQTNTTVFPTITNIQNVERVRTRGAEVAVGSRGLLSQRLDLDASVSFNHARTLENDNNPASVGKAFYRIPDWRADFVGTYHVMPWMTTTLAVRYSGRQFNTLDNTDIHPDTFGGTSRYLVADAKLGFSVGSRTTLGLGVENLTDERYFVYHPYPGRTYYAEARFRFD